MAPRILVCLAALLPAGCGSDEREQSAGAPAPVTLVTVRVDPDGTGPEAPEEAQVRCTKPRENRLCAAAGDLRPADLEPVPDDVACTQLFGGPETAEIDGTLNTRKVTARFSRSDGCEIARWERVAPLLEAAG